MAKWAADAAGAASAERDATGLSAGDGASSGLAGLLPGEPATLLGVAACCRRRSLLDVPGVFDGGVPALAATEGAPDRAFRMLGAGVGAVAGLRRPIDPLASRS